MTRVAAVGLGFVLIFGTAMLATADTRAGEKDVSVTGEVIDTFCYTAMGAKGTSHKQCGIDCAKKGIAGGCAPLPARLAGAPRLSGMDGALGPLAGDRVGGGRRRDRALRRRGGDGRPRGSRTAARSAQGVDAEHARLECGVDPVGARGA